MIRSITLYIDGEPKPQPRVKAYSRCGAVGVYTPDTAREWKEYIVAACAAKGITALRLDGPLWLDIAFYLPRPKSRKKEKYVATKPDLDNLAKAVMDALSDAEVWRDDALVVQLTASKIYSNKTGCKVVIREAAESEDSENRVDGL